MIIREEAMHNNIQSIVIRLLKILKCRASKVNIGSSMYFLAPFKSLFLHHSVLNI
uniref:Uncharacterized protein n=1 Tax=Lepeophtheirus salmonis TaxID=72036 RepID=A0A0K2VG52_LEPSM